MEIVKKPKQSVYTERLFDNIRTRLSLTEKELPDKDIKKVLNINALLIGRWIVDNTDGFKIKDNGILIISKFMPRSLVLYKEESLENIDNMEIPEYLKKLYKSRYSKRETQEGKKMYIRGKLKDYLYINKLMWFNKRNTSFKKAELYKFKCAPAITYYLREKQKVKEYQEWTPGDFEGKYHYRGDMLRAREVRKCKNKRKIENKLKIQGGVFENIFNK